MCSNVETNLSLTCLVSGLLNFEHPSVLLFCLHAASVHVEHVLYQAQLTECTVCFAVSPYVLYTQRQKEGDLTQSYDKSPYTHGNVKRAVTTQTTPQKSSIKQRLRTLQKTLQDPYRKMAIFRKSV